MSSVLEVKLHHRSRWTIATFGSIGGTVLIMGYFDGENPSFPNKVIIRISGVFFLCSLTT